MRLPSPVCAAPVLILAGLAALPGRAAAQPVSLEPDRDSTLYANNLDASNGAGNRLFVGRTTGSVGPLANRRALLRFDVAGAVPAGSLVTGVQLFMEVTNVPPSASLGTADLHRLEVDWGEAGSNGSGDGAPAQTGDATWRYRFYDTDPWSADGAGAGTDYVAASSGSASLGSGAVSWGSTADMVADVQLWLDAPAQNFGWVLIGTEVGVGTVRGLGSRENASSLLRPLLVIDASPPPPTPQGIPSAGPVGLLLTALLLAAAALWLERRAEVAP